MLTRKTFFGFNLRFMVFLVLVIGLMLTGCDGVVEQEKYNVSGEILDTEGDGVEGVTLNFSGGFGSAETDEDGKWNKSDLKGTVTVTPVKGGLVFEPNSREVSEEDNQVDFEASIDEGYEIDFVDSNLEQVVRDAINKPSGPIYISDVIELEELDASGRGIEELEGLQFFQSLTNLNLGAFFDEVMHDNYISDISTLSTLTNLEQLDLGRNEITDISPLTDLTNIESLFLGANKISDISPLEKLTNLEVLLISWNEVPDISIVEKLTNLKFLYFADNQVTDISPVEKLTNLELLVFDRNEVSDISFLGNLTNLEMLIFCRNELSDISPVENLTNLETLYFRNNEVSDISMLENLTNLEELHFVYNEVSEITALVNNTGFGSGDYIDLRYNYLDLTPGSQNMDDIIDLISRGVEVEYEPQREPGETDFFILDYQKYEDIYYIEDRWGIEFGKDYFPDN